MSGGLLFGLVVYISLCSSIAFGELPHFCFAEKLGNSFNGMLFFWEFLDAESKARSNSKSHVVFSLVFFLLFSFLFFSFFSFFCLIFTDKNVLPNLTPLKVL